VARESETQKKGNVTEKKKGLKRKTVDDAIQEKKRVKVG